MYVTRQILSLASPRLSAFSLGLSFLLIVGSSDAYALVSSHQKVAGTTLTTTTTAYRDSTLMAQVVQEKLITTTQTQGQRPLAAAPYPPYRGTLVLSDTLLNNSRGYHWEVDHLNNETCRFAHGGYDNIATQSPFLTSGGNGCMERKANYSNFIFEMQVTLLHATTPNSSTIWAYSPCTGMILRETHNRYGDATGEYSFLVCTNGHYLFATNQISVQIHRFSSAVHQGLKKPNLLAIVANQNHLNLYINHQHVGSYTDSSRYYFRSGEVGCMNLFLLNTVEAVCDNARLWTL